MRPAPQRPGDDLPASDDFAGWPSLGGLRMDAQAGPVALDLRRIDARVREALAPFESAAEGPRSHALRLEWTRADRPGWMSVAPREPARSVAWIENGALAWATHHVALLMDPAAERGIVVVTDQDAGEMARSAQNVLRVAVAWRLAAEGQGLLVHAAAVEDGGKAVVLLGPSGAGKSTAARLSAPRAVLADDVSLLLPGDDGLHLHPAPFWAEPAFPHRRDARVVLRVSRVLRLRQAAEHGLAALPRAAATASVMAHAPFLAGLQPLLQADSLASRIADAAPLSELRFARDPGFWSLLGN